MRYLRAYRFLFDSSGWTHNLFAGAVCELVPVLGPIVFTGYALELIEKLQKGDDRDYPAFDVNRLGPYLLRGLWPLIVQLLILVPVLFVAWIVGMVLLALISGDPPAPTQTPRALLALLFPAIFFAILLLSIPLAPLTLYVGLRQEVTGESLQFIRDFLQRVGKETALAQVFVAVTGTSAVVLGTSLCCVPAFAALALVHYAQYHLLGQLYQLYLERGGSAVPPRVEPAPEATDSGE
ncbi:MAG: DUF4013 domain-containing protein [Gemmataceae bacterium]|nr:DUF4013 domain-containing protein [Gemmataceae bacterium]